MISFNESIKKIESLNINSLGKENVCLTQAYGRTLAIDIIANENSPALATSGMDGYAIKASDQEKGIINVISKDNQAGFDTLSSVSHGKAIKTFTGALMPKGANTLIPIENVTLKDNYIIINEKVPKGFAVRNVGENYNKFDLLIPKNTKLDFSEIGVLAQLGQVMICVYIKPKIAILSTGSEILDLGTNSNNKSKIRSANNYVLQALVHKNQAQSIQLGVVSDVYKEIKNKIEDALQISDIVVTTGGVSVGDYDFVKDIIFQLDAKVIFKGVNIKPGRHTIVAQKNNKFIVALPGFAYSCVITFILYVIPLISRLKGEKYTPKIVSATLTQPFTKQSNKSEFTACNIELVNGLYEVNFNNKRLGTSAILTNMLGNVAILITSEKSTSLAKGDKVLVMLL